MSPPDDARLRHMLDAARSAIQFLEHESRSSLDADVKLALAVVRLLEVLGEAASGVSGDLRAAHPHLPWRELVGMRNRLIHGYASVDLDIVWRTIRQDLPALVDDLRPLCAGTATQPEPRRSESSARPGAAQTRRRTVSLLEARGWQLANRPGAGFRAVFDARFRGVQGVLYLTYSGQRNSELEKTCKWTFSYPLPLLRGFRQAGLPVALVLQCDAVPQARRFAVPWHGRFARSREQGTEKPPGQSKCTIQDPPDGEVYLWVPGRPNEGVASLEDAWPDLEAYWSRD